MFLKRIVSREYYRTSSHPNNANDSVLLTLECGHVVHRKGSDEPRNKAMCRECRIAAASVSS